MRRAVKGCGVQSGSGQHPAERETERKGPHGQGAGQVRTFQYNHVPPKGPKLKPLHTVPPRNTSVSRWAG